MFRISGSVVQCLGAENVLADRTPVPTKPPKLTKWNEETTLKFVSLYRQHECLWNTAHPQYKDKYRRFQACRLIADNMGLTDFGPSEVPRKIKILRSTYYQELMKIEKSKLNGEVNLYVPAIKWYSIMHHVLRDLPIKRQSPSAYMVSDDGTDGEQVHELLVPVTKEPRKSVAAVLVKSEELDDDCVEVQEIDEDDSVPSREEREHHFRRRALKRKAALRRHQLTKLKRSVLEDEFFIFGKHVATQLRLLEDEECVVAQEQIQTVLSQARLRTLQRLPLPL